ncbi:MAG: cytochrome c oxidase subunit II [Gemmatimonadota bacterium]|nr:cytochrome c oxidase subunit II [Gemmatimonadota bacterium]
MKLDRRSVGRMKPFLTLAAALLFVGVTGCEGPFPQSTFEPTTSFAEDLDSLFMMIFWIGMGVFVLVEFGVIYIMIRFRAREGAEDPKPVHGNTMMEIAWTIAPAIIIVFITIPTVQVIWKDANNNPPDALQVQAIGHQWWWEFRYPELGIVTANDLHLPQGRPVSIQLNSADVIHSFWLPRLAGKRDMVLGRNNRLVFTPDSTGEFQGQCAEFCGTSHANMRFKAFVHEAADFDEWAEHFTAAPAPQEELTELEQAGLAAFREIRSPASNSCIACHAVQGVSAGILGPNLNHVGDRSMIAGGLIENTDENLASWLRDPVAIKPGSLMPNIGLSEDEITALVAYLRSLR